MAPDGSELQPSSEPPLRHPLNALGPFYVMRGCCTACDVPRETAPDLFRYDEGRDCYVCRQPESEDELARMVRTLEGQELGCIRYGGSDEVIVRRIAENGSGELCDSPLRDRFGYVARPIVVFELADLGGPAVSSDALAREFASWLTKLKSGWTIEVEGPWVVGEDAELQFSWYESRFHRLHWTKAPGASHSWLVRYLNGPESYVPNARQYLHDLLTTRDDVSSIRWYADDEWAMGRPGRATPW